MSNLALAKALADFADALAEYNHLPAMEFAVVSRTGMVRMQPGVNRERVASVAKWAETFRVPVLLDLSDIDRGFVTVAAVVEIAARQAQVSVAIAPSSYREFEPGLGIGEVEAGEQVQVTAEQLLAAVSKAVA